MKERRIEVLRMIVEDVANDVMELDGAPFDGKVVAEMFGKQAAAIQALANILLAESLEGEKN